MRRVTRVGIVIAVLLLAGSSQASTLHVCPSGCDYSRIQDAIDAASPRDSIEVQSGFYNEQITINKDVTLKGVNTGKGLPLIYVIYLCNHPNSVVSDIGSIILLGNCPQKGISIYNNTVRIGMVKSNNTEIIAPSLDFKGEPSYVVELQANKSAVNPGDYFGLSVFISGVGGGINSSKLRVSIPPYIVQNERVNVAETNYSGNIVISNNRLPLKPHYSIQSYNGTLLNIALLPIYFSNYSDILTMLIVGENDHPFPDDRAKYCPPFTIEFKISDNAPPGDHNIYVDLFYKNKDKWLLDRQIVPIHVRFWYEKDYFQLLVIIALIMGSLASIIEICKAIRKWLDP